MKKIDFTEAQKEQAAHRVHLVYDQLQQIGVPSVVMLERALLYSAESDTSAAVDSIIYFLVSHITDMNQLAYTQRQQIADIQKQIADIGKQISKLEILIDALCADDRK